MFDTIYTILMTCAIIKISTMRCPIHLRRGQGNAMPMVAYGGEGAACVPCCKGQ